MKLMKITKLIRQEALIDSPMLSNALPLSEEEMEKLAEYFSSIPR